MPYIKQERRVVLNPIIEQLWQTLANDGELNYAITKLIDQRYGSGTYVQLNAGMGVLSCVAQEFYRRRIAPYEQVKCMENGDVFK